MPNETDRKEMCCSFCGKTRSQVSKLIQGPGGVYICDECVHACADMIDEVEGVMMARMTSTTRTRMILPSRTFPRLTKSTRSSLSMSWVRSPPSER